MRRHQIDTTFAANYGWRRWRCRPARESDIEPIPTAVDVGTVAKIVDTPSTGWKRFRDGDEAGRFERARVAQRAPGAMKATHPPSVNMAAPFRELPRDCVHVVDARRQTEEPAALVIPAIDQVSAGTCRQSGQYQMFN
jgi:hypothetical protein